jgi:MFS family permease
MSEEKAAIFFGIPYEVGVFALPLVGLYADKYGHRSILCIIGSVFFILAFGISSFLPSCEVSCDYELLPIILIGLGYATYVGVIWGLIPLVVEQNRIGTAFGIGISFVNIGLTISPEIAGYIVDHTSRDSGYFGQEIFFLGLNILGLMVHLYIHYFDIKY